MKRLGISNTVFVFLLIVVFPVYPVFGSVLYNISGGIQNFTIDTASIIEDEFDKDDSEFISADIPLEIDHNWSDRTEPTIYTIQDGDTIGQLAHDFGVSRDTIRWINNLPSNTLRTGQNLIIPPGNGYVHLSQTGDTLESIARKYAISVNDVIKTNTHLTKDLPAGSLVYLPGLKAPVVTSAAENREDSELSISHSFTHKLTLINPKWKWFVPGHCTYFVAKYWNVQWRWHAKDWYKNAQKAGYKTGKVAQPGAIVVWYGPGYNLAYGHVGIVMSVDTKKWTMIVKDMNYTGLWRITTRTEKLNNKYIIGFIYDQKK
jgi:LysM repeat protein